ncbi:hypothetical protein IAG44_03550 [Streptomyces roseirectus]|uniref:Uncharacterized protein n=2 Tax=Streptomyces roseirectus TaxID=2768066 RepID=A0A7H0IRZ1_9ACTN|nr:hypothetical protein [Streptomyces roseirectus]QNP75557.1 hypothetical protein IAG44_03550 [Streptomyces roseirectus]
MLAVLVVAGSPWVQRPLFDYYVRHYFDHETLTWFLRAAMAPGWEYHSDYYGGGSYLAANTAVTALLFAGILLLPARLPAAVPGWLRCLLGSLLASEAVYVLLWTAPEWFRPDAEELTYNGEVLKIFLRSGLIFGLAAGLLLALLTRGSPGTRVSARRVRALSSRRSRITGAGEGTAMRNVPLTMPLGRAPGDVTRYLCAAAYTDENFARRVVDEVLADEASAVAPSPDVDLVAVTLHSLAAQKLRYARDLRLSGAFALVALVAPLWLLPAAMLVGLAQRPVQPSLSTRGHHQPESRVLFGAAVTAGIITLVTFYFGVLLSSLPVPGFIGWLLGAYAGGVPAVLAALAAAAFAYAQVVQHDLRTDQLLRATMTRATFGTVPPPAPPSKDWVTRRLAAIGEAQNGNVTIYSGYTPWMGYGNTVSKYPLTVPLLPADDPTGRPGRPTPFTVTELIDHVRGRLKATAGEEALGSLTIEDRVFVNGTTLTDDERFLRDDRLTPVTRLSPETVGEIMRRPTGHVRHYLAVHVPLWGGDVVPSVLLHFSTASQTLQLHIDNHVMSPVRAGYHAVDRLRGSGLGSDAKRGVLLNALGRTGGALLAAPLRALHHGRFEKLHARRMDDELKAMEQDPGYDYGARVSVREMALGPEYQNYFQVLDADRVTALIQRHTFAAIREFLDAHGYDTTDFRAQQQTILNQGVIQQGGTSIIGNQAIGAGATALQGIPQQQSGAPAPSPAGGSTK